MFGGPRFFGLYLNVPGGVSPNGEIGITMVEGRHLQAMPSCLQCVHTSMVGESVGALPGGGLSHLTLSRQRAVGIDGLRDSLPRPASFIR